MILTCPECGTRYHLDPASLGDEGRTVRCANCGKRWLARQPADTPRRFVLPPVTPERHSPLQLPASRVRGRPHSTSRSLAGWIVGVVVVLLIAASAVIGRERIVATFPASVSIYQTLGLPVTVELGLEFENVGSERLDERGVAILVLKGEIVNLSGQERSVPPVRVTLLDESGRPLQDELVFAEDNVVPAGGRTGFTGRVVNPAEQARRFSLTFDVRS